MKKRYLLWSVSALFLLGACSDKLDIQKHGNMGSQDEFYKTDDDAMQALASLYNTWGGQYYNWAFVTNLLSDDAWTGGGTRGDNADLEQLNEYTFDTDSGMIEGLYSGLYSIIYKANLIIEKIAPDTPVKSRAIADAKFFRAWAHFQLVSLWGTAPVVDHLLSPSEYRLGNSTPDKLWAFVEQDLTEAIESDTLPSKSAVDDAVTGIRVTKELAQAMLGKAYVFQEKYAEAAAILDKVIASEKYKLFDEDSYDMMLHARYNNNCESMLDVQKREDPEQMWSMFTMWYLMTGWRTSDTMTIGGESAGVLASGTYGFMNPRKSLYDAFVEHEGKDGYRLNQTLRHYDDLESVGVTINAGSSVVGNEGYFMWKTRILVEDCTVDQTFFQGMQYTNLHVMRYAEVLLLAAEAHVKGGDADKALDYVNRVRSRARLASLGTVTMDDVKKEKRLELCMESVRFQDLVRWGDAETVLADQGRQIPAFNGSSTEWRWNNSSYGFKPKHKLLPIPRKEMDLNPSMTQNEGW